MTSTRNDKVKVQLRVFKSLECYPGGANDYFVAVVGPGIQLGNDNPEIAPRCKPIGRNVWEKDLWLPKDSFVNYKFLVVRSCTGKVVDIESTTPHTIYIGQHPIMVEHTYNKTAFAGKEANPEHNCPAPSVGRKETFHVPSLNIPRADKVGFVVPKIKNPSKYVPPRNIGLIHCKRMEPATVHTDDIIKTGADVSPDIPPHVTKSNTHTPCAAQKTNKSPGATKYISNDNFAVKITNSVHSGQENDTIPPVLTENNNALRATVPSVAVINDNISSSNENNNLKCATKDKDDVACATKDKDDVAGATKDKDDVAGATKDSGNSTRVTENNDISGNEIIREKDSTGQMDDDITKKLDNNACLFRFGKKTLGLAVSGISLISALGYFSFFSR
ncbi:uncharacterized protein LOC132735633 [Ruditapes philippinarum]|uniref:uncharacterized protein LOC132735633 n=1 Tax=Ruditapes philippinarum TaxID=129788 RepID=UPI00295AD449|nr:uncharacterized protein LOC132735633 [Ruditapes philippinarum]